MSDIDVIILSWNRTDDTLAAIDSALAQSGVEAHVMVVDQGSTTGNLGRLLAHVARLPNVSVRALGRNVGVPEGRNIASAMGSAPYIVALDNDAVFPDPHVLRRTIDRFEADPKLGVIAFRILNYYTGHDDEMCWDYPDAVRPLAGGEFDATRFIGAGHAIRRAAFTGAGGYDGALFFGGEERDLAYRILDQGYRVRYIAALSVLHKSDPEARVKWDGGRYYYAVRNCLYTDWKCGASWARLVKASAALLLKGLRNGLAGQALHGVRDAIAMAATRVRERRRTRISSAVRARIDAIERLGRGSFWLRLRRQMSRLPGSG